MRRFLKDLSNSILERDFVFSFNEDGILYDSLHTNTSIKWEMFDRYTVNNGELYVFYQNGQLCDIFSEKIMGRTAFEGFKHLVSQKLKRDA